MHHRRLSASLACVLALIAAPGSLAQDPFTPSASPVRGEAASISGRVIDHSTGDPLENARVVIAGTALITSTERGGTFTLRGVPPGDHTLVASYTGFDSVSRPVQAAAGRDATV